MKKAVAIYHLAFEDLGSFAPVLREAGYEIAYASAVHDLARVDPKGPDLLVICGGPIGVYEEEAYPFIKDEKRLIAERLAAGRPTLGICLGGQMMAAALGASVKPGTKELGFSTLTLTDAGANSPLKHLEGVPVLHWHGDTFDIPAGAELLASTDICRNQAFAIGRHALGLQCHPEGDLPALEDWFVAYGGDLASAKLSVPEMRKAAMDAVPRLREAGSRMLKAWLDGLAG
jgi:GMP synthase (glutamine-hydrolysing)